MLIVGNILLLLPPLFIIFYLVLNYYVPGKKSVCIVVLGDIGRSPRMQYHSLSFLKCGFCVDIVGYGGSEIQSGLQNNDKVKVYYLWESPSMFKILPRILQYIFKVFWQTFSLGSTMLLMPKSGYILVQNPPCIPTFAVAIFVCFLRGSKLVIDWHNYGYTIMGLTLGYENLLVKFAKWFEKFFGKFASSNICVTKALQEDLNTNFHIKASVMYDRPPEMFRKTPINDSHKLFMKLAEKYKSFGPKSGLASDGETAFTVANGGEDVYYLQSRPALVVSSTSWTEDEDFGILLSALEEYDQAIIDGRTDLPNILCVITGKGPLKGFYQRKIESQLWQHVSFCLPWLTPNDYPLLLGSADLGICLHKSSSGLDLPMKIVDMFGCGLPVCAIHFNCLNELVVNDENGCIFQDSHELAQHLQSLLHSFPVQSEKLDQFRQNLVAFQSMRWHKFWKQSVLPLFEN